MSPLSPPDPAATPPVAMTIAGSDSSGGAGIQADLRTFAAHGVHGTSAIAALTAQNTVGVQGVHGVPADFVVAQIESIVADADVGAVKTGMLGTAATVVAVADVADRLRNLVVDPVMVASTGARLLDAGAERAYRERLLPLATLITPNVEEAEVLLGDRLPDRDAVVDAAGALARTGPSVLITGGDGGAQSVLDVMAIHTADHIVVSVAEAPRVDTANDHGSGCSLSSSIAARLARGERLEDAIAGARAFVHRGLRGGAGWRLGAGHGPIDHLGWNAPAEPSDLSPPIPIRTVDRGDAP